MCDLWSDIHRQKRGNDPLNELERSYPHSRRFDQTLQQNMRAHTETIH
jgi:hypothetical protein